MKCLSCGNLIPENSTVCPYCNAEVTPVTTEASVPTYDIDVAQQTNLNPFEVQTPPIEQPSMPSTAQAQEIVQNNPSIYQGETQNVGNTASLESINTNPSMLNASTLENAPVNSQVNTQQQEGGIVGGMTQNQGEIPNSATNQVPPIPPVPPITPAPVIVDGTKIANAAPVIDEKKKKNKFILIIVLVLVFAAIIGCISFFYFSQFKSADKRIDSVVNGVFSFANGVKNENIEAKSGSYNIDFSFSANENEASAKLNGKYAYDLKKKIIDVTLNAESIKIQEELIPEGKPLNIELYTYDSKLYVLLQNFYENYIYTDIEGYNEAFEGIEKNDINYQIILNAYKTALKNGLKASNYKQSIEDITIDGKKEKANSIRIVLDKKNQEIVTKAAFNSLLNNTKAIEEIAKLNDETPEQLKEELKSSLEKMEYSENTIIIDIYTSMFQEQLLKMNFSGKNEEDKSILVEIIPDGKAIKIIGKEENKEMLTLTYKESSKRNSTTIEKNYEVDMVFYGKDELANKIKGTVALVEDINPKVEKVNIKNSVSANNIPVEDQQRILSEVYNYGSLGLMLQMFIGGSTSLPITNNPTVESLPAY